jgi:hypothetical protein
MSTLTISVPESVIARLHQRAKERGTTPEAVAADDVARATLPPGYGRLRSLAGTLNSDLTDASVRTDEYLTDPAAAATGRPHG